MEGEVILEKILPLLLQEIESVLSRVRQGEIEAFTEQVAAAARAFIYGAGRVGTASRALAMRLTQLGKSAYWVPDDTTPSIGPGDLLIANSGSGGSLSSYNMASLAKKAGSKVATITANAQGKIAQIADVVLVLNAQTYKTDRAGWGSILPMGSQFELCLWIIQDILCLALMRRLGVNEAAMMQRHRNLE